MTNRLEELRKELEKGRQQMEALDRQRQELRDTMLRISGAIQVIEELLAQQAPANAQPELAAINT
jgi:prefoldin subunit 5